MKTTPKNQKEKEGETAQGHLLWRGLTRVVSLAVNIRAPGVLGRLQSEMRRGSISDEMWSLYLSRIVQRQDPRLQQSPFSTSDVQYIVHRHRLRTRQSFNNAIDHCQRNDSPIRREADNRGQARCRAIPHGDSHIGPPNLSKPKEDWLHRRLTASLHRHETASSIEGLCAARTDERL